MSTASVVLGARVNAWPWGYSVGGCFVCVCMFSAWNCLRHIEEEKADE